MKELITEYIKNNIQDLFEELEKQSSLEKLVKKKLGVLKKSSFIDSFTSSNKSDMAIVVRVEDKETINAARKKVRSVMKAAGLNVEDRLIKKFDSSIETSEVSAKDGSGRVYVVYKYDSGSRGGLALEHIVALFLTGKVTDELRNRLDLPSEASLEEIKSKLKQEFSEELDVAIRGKDMIQQKLGKIIDAEPVGSKNSKADLILTNKTGEKYGLSIKLVTEEGRELRFNYNRNLGYGDEKDDNLVRNPSGKPWWLVCRQLFAKKLGRSYNPNKEDLEAPAWMVKAKKSKKDLYKEAMEETYEKLRNVFVSNLRNKKLSEIVEMVNEASLGSKEERQEYDRLLVLISDVDGIRLEEKGNEIPDIEAIRQNGVNKNNIVYLDGAKIIIDIPGMSPFTIHGLKFHSDVLSSKKDDHKIKTR